MQRTVRVLAGASVLAAGLAVGTADPGVAHATATVPTGFTDAAVVGVNAPTAVESLGDGRIVVLNQNGRVYVLRDGDPLPAPSLTISVCGGAGTEMGLLGFTTANDFAATGHVFVYYTATVAGGCVNRVSRFTMTGTTIARSSEVVLVDNIPGTVTESFRNHNGGDLEMGDDGYLYISVGDSGSDPRNDSGSGAANDAAQDMGLLSGKILRIGPDGSIPADNPFTGADTARCADESVDTSFTCQEIFASGLRNPYRFAFDPNDGGARFFINDVGQSAREEVDEGIKGANYGWNEREGQCPTGESPPCAAAPSAYTDPLTDYPRSTGTYITAGAFVPDGVWPERFDGGYLFADGGSGKIFLREADGTVDYNAPVVTGVAGLADMAFVPDADGYALVYSLNGSDEVRKITYSGAPDAASVDGLRLVPVAPTRVYDTRNGIGATAGVIRAGGSRQVDVQVPDAAVKAVLANVTLVGADGPGYLQAWPTGAARPATSIINAVEGGEIVANSVLLPVADDGTVLISTSMTTDLLVDVLGYFTEATTPGGEYRSLTPSRLLDTRQDAITPSGTEEVDLMVAGEGGVPDDGSAGSVALIVTTIGSASSDSSYTTVYPTGTTRPEASNVNTFGPSDIRANLVVVPLGTDGSVSLYGFDTDGLIVDLAGWFTADSVPATGDGLLTVMQSDRVVDTRQTPAVGFGPLADGGRAVLGFGSVVPADATAVVQNLTVAESTAWGFVAATPADVDPEVSNLNVTGPGQIRAALAITELSSDQEIAYSTLTRRH
ncbi:MAG: PQQ-dependent sugar dehydrogenase [Ilumatobacteraceae bacterium]